MKKFTYALLLTLLLSLFTLPVFAAGLTQEVPATDPVAVILEVGASLATLAGVSAVISLTINIFKYFGVIKPDTANQWFAGVNLVVFIGLCVTRIFAPQFSLEFIDAQAARVAQAGAYIVALIFQIWAGQQAYKISVNTGLPIIGYSATKEEQGGKTPNG